jgi:hypothetical protein
MGTLGKVLLFVNLLVAAGLVYVISQDWAKRHDAAAVALRHQLMLVGLPVEPQTSAESGVPLKIETAGGYVVETASPKLLADHFQGADGGPALGGPPPKSQVEEVKRVQGKVDAQLAAAASPADKLALLCGRFTQQGFTPGWLAALAESYEERELVRTLAATPARQPVNPADVERDAAAAEAMLKRKFEAVVTKPNPQAATEEAARLKELSDAVRQADAQVRQATQNFAANSNPQTRQALTAALQGMTKALDDQKAFLADAGASAARDEPDRRRRIAHLLAHLDKDAAWQKRVALVVGLRTYLAAVQDQVARLKDMAAGVQQQMVLDQATFSETYEVLKNLANYRAILLDQQARLTADLAAQRTRDREEVQQRLAQLQRRQQDLADLQAQVAAALTRQGQIEQGLFAVEKQVGETMQRNLELEQKLAEAETAKAGK